MYLIFYKTDIFMIMQNKQKKMYYLFSTAADQSFSRCGLRVTKEIGCVQTIIIIFFFFFFACGTHGSRCLRAAVRICLHTRPQNTLPPKRRRKNMFLSCCWKVVILLGRNMTFETKCAEENCLLSTDKCRQITNTECHFKRCLKAINLIIDYSTDAPVADNKQAPL